MFCRNCGKELCDKAFVCTECGCLVEGQPPKVKRSIRVGGDETVKEMRLLNLFLIVSFSCLMLALIIVLFTIYTSCLEATYHSFLEIFVAETKLLWRAFFLSLVALGTGITAFVISLKKKVSEASHLITIMNFIFSLAMVGLTIAMLWACEVMF